MEATNETEGFNHEQKESNKVPISLVESDKSKSNHLDQVSNSTVDNLPLGKLNVSPQKLVNEHNVGKTYSDVVQEGVNPKLELFIHWGQTLLAPHSFICSMI